MKEWLLSEEHFTHPYPTNEDQAWLIAKTGIDKRQLKVRCAFIPTCARVWTLNGSSSRDPLSLYPPHSFPLHPPPFPPSFSTELVHECPASHLEASDQEAAQLDGGRSGGDGDGGGGDGGGGGGEGGGGGGAAGGIIPTNRFKAATSFSSNSAFDSNSAIISPCLRWGLFLLVVTPSTC